MKTLLIILVLLLSGCAVSGQIRDNGAVILRGWGAKSITFPDGTKLEKEEPIRVPDIVPVNK